MVKVDLDEDPPLLCTGIHSFVSSWAPLGEIFCLLRLDLNYFSQYLTGQHGYPAFPARGLYVDLLPSRRQHYWRKGSRQPPTHSQRLLPRLTLRSRGYLEIECYPGAGYE